MPYKKKADHAAQKRRYRAKQKAKEKEKLERLKEFNDKLKEVIFDTELKLMEAGDDWEKKEPIYERHAKLVKKLYEIYDSFVEGKPKKKKRRLIIKL